MIEERKVLERVLEEATDFLDGLKDRRVAARRCSLRSVCHSEAMR
jgi:hypothetical protein